MNSSNANSTLRREDLVDSPKQESQWIDLVLAILLTFATAFWGDLLGSGPWLYYYVLSVLISVAFVMPLALRRTNPIAMTCLIAAAGALHVLLIPAPTWSLISIPVASYSMARWVEGKSARLIVVVGGIGSFLGPIRWASGDHLPVIDSTLLSSSIPLMAFCLAWTITPYLLGRRDRETAIARIEREAVAQERYESELIKREQDTRMMEARVRSEIARELHDVVAHSLSVIIVQADGGKALARKRPEAAIDALTTISKTGREALGEMRHIVGVLRAAPDSEYPAEFQPAPGLSDIEGMTKKAGDRVTFATVGNQPTVPPAIGVTAYRIVQEGITNFLRHAQPTAKATVTLVYHPQTIDIEISNDAPDPDPDCEQQTIRVQGSGFGIQGMHERVNAMGGKLVAEPLPTGGWHVSAMLPLSAAARAKNIVSTQESNDRQPNSEQK